jgi:hypothetical protein
MPKTQTVILATSITAIALVSVFLGAMVFLHAASAASNDDPSTTTQNNTLPPWKGGGNGTFPFRGPPQPPGGHFFRGGALQGGPPANLAVSQKITLTCTNGRYVEYNDTGVNGTASGTLDLSVTDKLAQGYTLSITGGSVSIGSNTYTISSGSIQTGLSASNISGQGSTSSSGTFLIPGQARGSFAGTTANVGLDIKIGSTEYFVTLATSVQS